MQRSDRSISAHGLEARTPFLDREFVKTYLSIPSDVRYNTNIKQEKFLFRSAFDKDYIPSEILWRRKEAFSDGVSSTNRSWYQIINERIENHPAIKYDLNAKYEFNKPETLEQLYYRTLYDKFFPKCEKLIPYFWMPKYVDAKDASARSLTIYQED